MLASARLYTVKLLPKQIKRKEGEKENSEKKNTSCKTPLHHVLTSKGETVDRAAGGKWQGSPVVRNYAAECRACRSAQPWSRRYPDSMKGRWSSVLTFPPGMASAATPSTSMCNKLVVISRNRARRFYSSTPLWDIPQCFLFFETPPCCHD